MPVSGARASSRRLQPRPTVSTSAPTWSRPPGHAAKCLASSNKKLLETSALLVARTLLGAPGPTTRNKKLLVASGIATRSKGRY